MLITFDIILVANIVILAGTIVGLSIIMALCISRKKDRNITLILPTDDTWFYVLIILTIIAMLGSIISNVFVINHYEDYYNSTHIEIPIKEEAITELPGIVDNITTDTGVTYGTKTEARIVLNDDRGTVYCKVHFGQLYLEQEIIVGATESGKVIYLTYDGEQHYIDYGE